MVLSPKEAKMTTTKVFIGTRFDSDRVKALEKIAKMLHISKNAVIENAFDIYAEEVLGVITPSDNTIKILEDRIKALEHTLSSSQPKVITPSDNTKEPKVITPTEPQAKLTRAEFQDRFNITDEAYGNVGSVAKRLGVWTAKDGSQWKPSGTKANRLWSCCLVTN